MTDVKLLGYVPGAIGRVAELHAVYYAENWGFGQFFEAKVATELSEFLSRFEQGRDGFWTTCLSGRVEGAIAIDGIKAESDGAHLRWFIMSSKLRGQGFGKKLMEGSPEAVMADEKVKAAYFGSEAVEEVLGDA